MKPILRRAAALVLCAALLIPTALASGCLGQHHLRLYLRHLRRHHPHPGGDVERVQVRPPHGKLRHLHPLRRHLPRGELRHLGGEQAVRGRHGQVFGDRRPPGPQRHQRGLLRHGHRRPLGLVVTDGVLRSSASYLQALGFLEDGSAIIGTPNLDLKANFKGIPSKSRTSTRSAPTQGFTFSPMTSASTTRNTQAGVDVILTPQHPGRGIEDRLHPLLHRGAGHRGHRRHHHPPRASSSCPSLTRAGNGFRRSSAPWPPGTPWTSASPPRTPAGRT